MGGREGFDIMPVFLKQILEHRSNLAQPRIY